MPNPGKKESIPAVAWFIIGRIYKGGLKAKDMVQRAKY
jgi:hypothetical protein